MNILSYMKIIIAGVEDMGSRLGLMLYRANQKVMVLVGIKNGRIFKK